MSFRDDIDAAYARFEVLDTENRRLVDEYAQLCRRAAPPRPPIPEDHDAVLARIEELERENPRLVAENAKLRAGAPLPPLEPTPKPWPYDSNFSWDHLSITPAPSRKTQIQDLPPAIAVFIVVVLMLLAAAAQGH